VQGFAPHRLLQPVGDESRHLPSMVITDLPAAVKNLDAQTTDL
jgi:hypothetical protein